MVGNRRDAIRLRNCLWKKRLMSYVYVTPGCILRGLHLKSYEKKLEKITGKKWKGKITYRPEKTKGCLIGGSILFTSHNCADVRRVGILKYGVMDKIILRWKKKKMEIISTYKPYPSNAKGSLLTAVNDVEGDFEDRYWRLLKQSTNKGSVVIGGDFNMNEEKMDEVLKRTHIKRVCFEEGRYTFKCDVGTKHKE